MFSTILLLTAISLLIYAFYKWATLNNDYFLKKGVAFKKPAFLIGNSGAMLLRKMPIAEYIKCQYNQFPDKKINGVFDLRSPSFIIRDPELVKQIAVKDFDHFLDHKVVVDDTMDPLFGNVLISLHGQKWKDMRSTLSPVFTSSKMKQMFDLVSDCGEQISKHFLSEHAKNGRQILEMKDVFSRFANDVIATSAFGIKVNSLEDKNNEFFAFGKEMTDFTKPMQQIKLFGYTLTPWIMRTFKVPFLSESCTNFFSNMIKDTMSYRGKEGIIRPDMINLLMQSKKGNLAHTDEKETEGFATVEEHEVGRSTVKREWTDQELVSQCFLFFFAGFDTSSTALSLIAHELAVNPEVQEKLFEEIVETNSELNGKRLTYDALQKMKYMDMVVSEGLRKWPPAPATDRLCVKDYVLKDVDGKDISIEKGINTVIPIYGFHHDPQYFPNPDKFDPERFSNENKGNINSGTYLPFGIGPRNCIGSRFALMEVKAVLYYILLDFTFEICEKSVVPFEMDRKVFTLIPGGGVWLEFKPRTTKEQE